MTSSEKFDEEIGIHEFHCSGCEWTAVLDERRQALSLYRQPESWIRLHLDTFLNFSRDFTAFSKEHKVAFRRAVEQWARKRTRLPNRPWMICLQRLAFYLVQW